MRLVQFSEASGQRRVGRVDGEAVEILGGVGAVYELAQSALRSGRVLAELAAEAPSAGRVLRCEELLAAGRLLPPLDHPDPARCVVS